MSSGLTVAAHGAVVVVGLAAAFGILVWVRSRAAAPFVVAVLCTAAWAASVALAGHEPLGPWPGLLESLKQLAWLAMLLQLARSFGGNALARLEGG
ncbi:MAG TPA: hypothetical protein VEA41_00220, partial [Salinarimonas sp.]|nr:hypothetical protein [Salinarimonas sp.]